MDSHPVLSILYNKYNGLFHKMSNKIHIIVLPEPKTLLNININLDFLKKHIFYKSHLANTYTNLLEQCAEIDQLYIKTTYGFQEKRKCKILKTESNFQSKFFKAIFVDCPLEGHHSIIRSTRNTQTTGGKETNTNSQKIGAYADGTKSGSIHNKILDDFFESEILGFLYSYIIIPGYEIFIGKKIVHIVTQTLQMQKNINKKENVNDTIAKNALIKQAYSLLHTRIWDHLTKNYKKIESMIQKKMSYLKQNVSLFLKKSNLNNFKPIQIQNIALRLSQIETCDNPVDKILILDRISKMICELITYNTENCKTEETKILNTFDIDSDTLISVLSVIIVYSKLKNVVSHAIHMHMYINNLAVEEKIDNLSFVFTIFHSSIIYLCDIDSV